MNRTLRNEDVDQDKPGEQVISNGETIVKSWENDEIFPAL